MMQLAGDTGITREGLYKALGERGTPALQRWSRLCTRWACSSTWVLDRNSAKSGVSPRGMCASSYHKCSIIFMK
jgi:hypothetical protein